MNKNFFEQFMSAGNTVVPNLLFKYYQKLGINNEQLLILLQLKSMLDQGDPFPNVAVIGSQMEMEPAAIFQQIHQLIQKGCLQLDTVRDEAGKTQDQYRLDPLWNKLALLLSQAEQEQLQEKFQNDEADLYQLFEQEFSRPLSPIELETIGMWIDQDHYSVAMIKLALREAVLSQVYNLKYVDRILLNWEKRNIRTPEQVEKESAKHREQKSQQQAPKYQTEQSDRKVPLHNWLKDQ